MQTMQQKIPNLHGLNAEYVADIFPHPAKTVQYCRKKVYDAFCDGKFDHLLRKTRRVKERTLFACAIIITSFMVNAKYRDGKIYVSNMSAAFIAETWKPYDISRQTIKLALRRMRECGMLTLVSYRYTGNKFALWEINPDVFHIAECDKAVSSFTRWSKKNG